MHWCVLVANCPQKISTSGMVDGFSKRVRRRKHFFLLIAASMYSRMLTLRLPAELTD